MIIIGKKIALVLFSAYLCILHFENCDAFETIFNRHKKYFRFFHESKPKLLVFFSGPPGIGKTTLANQLEEELHALRISSKEINPIFHNLSISTHKKQGYLKWCLRHLNNVSPNHLVLLDRRADRGSEDFFQFAKVNDYKTFIIRLVADQQEIEQRINNRGIYVQEYLSGLGFFLKQCDEFAIQHPPDFIFNSNEGSFEKSKRELLEAIRERL